jgi:UDP-N-acetylmuramate dehydrogenase
VIGGDEVVGKVSRSALVAIAEALPAPTEFDAPLSRHTWLGLGGPVDLLVVAQSREVLVQAVQLARAHGVPWRVYGGFTNILPPDGGLRGLVVLNHARDVQFGPDYRLSADSGAIIIKVAREAVERGWGGLTWAVGLPGTVGGAVVNNAGAFGGEIEKVLVGADVLDEHGQVHQVPVSWFGFQYRCSKLKGAGQHWLVLRAEFQLRAGATSLLKAKAESYTERRQRTQPPGRTLGSTFKNPTGDHAGRLIEAAGLKGTRCGGIVVSPYHANFFINDGGGTAAEFRILVRRVQKTVFEKFGIMLEPEIEMLPEPEMPQDVASTGAAPNSGASGCDEGV